MASYSILRGVAEDEGLYWMAAARSEAHSTWGIVCAGASHVAQKFT
jgi:hypothetical protein